MESYDIVGGGGGDDSRNNIKKKSKESNLGNIHSLGTNLHVVVT